VITTISQPTFLLLTLTQHNFCHIFISSQDAVITLDNCDMREFSAVCLKEYAIWSIKQTSLEVGKWLYICLESLFPVIDSFTFWSTPAISHHI